MKEPIYTPNLTQEEMHQLYILAEKESDYYYGAIQRTVQIHGDERESLVFYKKHLEFWDKLASKLANSKGVK